MEDMQPVKSCSFCNLFSAIQCMMQELKEDHIRKSHSLEVSNNDGVQSVDKQNGERQKLSQNVIEIKPVAKVLINSEKIKEKSVGYFKNDSADDKSEHVNDDTTYDNGVGTMNDYNEGSMDNDVAKFDNDDDNLKFTNETINDNSYDLDEFIFNVNDSTLNDESKNESMDIEEDNLKNFSVDEVSINNAFDTDKQEDIEIRLSNESKIWNHFQIKQDTKLEGECIYCGKVLKRKAGKTSSFLNHLRDKHQDKLPVELHRRKFNRSIAWNHFKPVPSDNERAECKYCGMWMSKVHGTTTNMIRHLITKHPLVNIESIEKVKPNQDQDQVFSEYSKDDSINTDRASSSSSVQAEEGLIDMLIDEKGTFNNYSNVVTSDYIKAVDQESIADGEDNNVDSENKEFSATAEITEHHGFTDIFFERDTDNDDDRKYTNDISDTKDTKYNITESKSNDYNKAPMSDNAHVPMNDDNVFDALTLFDTKESLQSNNDLVIKTDIWNHFQIKPNSNDEAECNYCNKVLNFCGDMIGPLMYHLKHEHPINGQKIIRTRVKKSLVWDHCKVQPNSDKIECNYCNMTYSYKDGCTTNIKRHVQNKHPQKYINPKNGEKILGKGSITSLLLDNFEPQPDTHRKTECKYCGIWISNSNGNTTRMLKHLRINHEELMKSQTIERKFNDKKSNRSLVWDYFKPPEKGERVMKCSYCRELFSNPDGNKTDMIKHLQIKHPSKIQAFTKETEKNFKSKEDIKIYDNIKKKEVNRPANSIWEHFRFQDNAKDKVQCKYCDNCEKPSTMISHLRKNHPSAMKTFTGIKQ